MSALVRDVTPSNDDELGQEPLALLGFRDSEGKRSDRTEALDQALISAAITNGLAVAPDVGVLVAGDAGPVSRNWLSGSLLPQGWQEIPAPRVLSGLVRYEQPWAYVRLVLAETASGVIVAASTGRISEARLERRARRLASARSGTAEESDFAAAIDLHILIRRADGDFAELVELSEKAVLKQGDQLQIRYKVDKTCAVYAFLQQSDGDRQDIVSSDRVYSGRLHYAPGENQWIDLTETNQVFTLYFIAAERLPNERRADLFDELDELTSSGQLDRYTGIDLMDARLIEFLKGQIAGAGEVAVLRGEEGIETGEVETFIYSNGESFKSSPQMLPIAPVLVRAYTFEVQYN